MSIPSKQIGWSNESNLLWEISKQMERLTKVVYANAGGGSTYKVYTALLDQTGVADPTVTVLENTLGAAITWTRDSEGIYYGELSAGTFDPAKTFINIQSAYYAGPYTAYGAVWQDDNMFIVLSFYDNAGALNDIAGTGVPVEIRVYN
jgi:hypothetical protein